MSNVANVIHEWADKPFNYHGTDCCRFVAAIAEAVTGDNPMESFTYVGDGEAKALIAKHGSLKAVMTATLGTPIDVSAAVTGDIVLVYCGKSGQIAGSIIGDRVVVKTPDGIVGLNLRHAVCAWSV